MEEQEAVALSVVSEAVDDGSIFYLAGVPRDVALLHLIRRAGKNRVRLINPQFPPDVSQRSFFIEKLRRLWGLDILEENYPQKDQPYSEDEKIQKIIVSFRSHGGKKLLMSSQGDDFFLEKDGVVRVMPLCSYSDADALEYVRKYKLPLCSLDKEETDTEKREVCTGTELTGRLKDLGYL